MRDILPVVVDGLWRQGAKNLAVRGSRDFPSKNDKVLWRPRRLWPPEGYYFFRDPYLGSV